MEEEEEEEEVSSEDVTEEGEREMEGAYGMSLFVSILRGWGGGQFLGRIPKRFVKGLLRWSILFAPIDPNWLETRLYA